MARKFKAAELPNIEVGEIIDGLNTGAEIVGATLPILKELAEKIIEWGKGLEIDALSLPRGKRKAIEALQALEKVDQQKQVVYDGYFAQLIEKGIVTP